MFSYVYSHLEAFRKIAMTVKLLIQFSVFKCSC